MTEAEWLACEDALGIVYCPALAKHSMGRLPAVIASFHDRDRLGPLLSPKSRALLASYAAWARGTGPHPAEGRREVGGYPYSLDVDDFEEYNAELAACDLFKPGEGDWAHVADFCMAEAYGSVIVGRSREAKADTIQWKRLQVAWLRDIIGNPFHPCALPSAHRTPAITTLACAAYEERELPLGHLDNARLGVLSDAMEEAGCTDEALLGHLRSAGPHVRGCWALDLVLGKE